MLETVEVLAGSRRSLRRAIDVECDVLSQYWDEPVSLLALDLSVGGMWLDAELPLDVGDSLRLRFHPPRWKSGRPLIVNAEVRRVDLQRRRFGAPAAGMGIAFTDLNPWERDALRLALEGIPPPLPFADETKRTDLIWVESLLTWEEDLGDRVNIYEVSEWLGLDDGFDAEEIEFFAVGEMLTSPLAFPFRLAA
ncbi:MAG: PilZ domain-containing protein [Polyangiales bacterium]|nr:PilZ domain-containing protein [Myxococcales bacterium]